MVIDGESMGESVVKGDRKGRQAIGKLLASDGQTVVRGCGKGQVPRVCGPSHMNNVLNLPTVFPGRTLTGNQCP